MAIFQSGHIGGQAGDHLQPKDDSVGCERRLHSRSFREQHDPGDMSTGLRRSSRRFIPAQRSGDGPNSLHNYSVLSRAGINTPALLGLNRCPLVQSKYHLVPLGQTPYFARRSYCGEQRR